MELLVILVPMGLAILASILYGSSDESDGSRPPYDNYWYHRGDH